MTAGDDFLNSPTDRSVQTIQRYSERYRKLGRDVRTLGWGSYEQQEYRFAQTLSLVDLSHKNVLDIGCGFADYYAFLRRLNVQVSRYVGYDINPDFIAECESTYSADNLAEFGVVNVHNSKDLERLSTPVADVAVMLGLLNFNFHNERENLEFSKVMICNALRLVRSVLIVDFLSAVRTPDYPEESFVYYHRPERMLKFALTLSSNVILKHDYAPIPQKEFMLVIEKQV